MQSILVPCRYLDPRSAAAATADPIAAAVHIPAAELPRRTHELPSRDEDVAVADTGDEARAVVAWLQQHGRRATLVRPPSRAGERIDLCRGRLWQPNPWLASIAAELAPGRVLDLGCGTGRDAVYLASAGCAVTAVDALPDALQRGQDLAARYPGLPGSIEWVATRLDEDWQPPAGGYDLIVAIRYLPRALLRHLAAWLKPGGSFVGETFTTLHRDRHGRPAGDDDVLAPEEWPALLPGLEVCQHLAGWSGDVHSARVWAQRPG